MLCEKGDDQEALNVLEGVYYKRKEVLGPSNLYTLITQNLIAQVLLKQCKYQEALNVYQEIYPKQKEILGSNHPEVLATKNNMDIAQVLVKEKVIQNKHQMLLHLATREGNLNKVKSLIQNGAKVNIKDNDGSNPLHWAAHNGYSSIVKLLLENGADPTQVTNKGNTPLHIATSKGHREIIKVLLQHVGRDKLNDFINAKTTSGGTTSLHVAAKNGFLEIVKSLLKNGATYNIENKKDKTPINFSKDQGVIDLLKLIEELFEDAKKGNVEIISKLKAVKPDEFVAATNARNNQGNTLLQVAIANKHKNIASKLLEMLKKPDQNLQDVNIEDGIKSLKL